MLLSHEPHFPTTVANNSCHHQPCVIWRCFTLWGLPQPAGAAGAQRSPWKGSGRIYCLLERGSRWMLSIIGGCISLLQRPAAFTPSSRLLLPSLAGASRGSRSSARAGGAPAAAPAARCVPGHLVATGPNPPWGVSVLLLLPLGGQKPSKRDGAAVQAQASGRAAAAQPSPGPLL